MKHIKWFFVDDWILNMKLRCLCCNVNTKNYKDTLVLFSVHVLERYMFVFTLSVQI